jgi:hypothetical protein
VAQSSRRRKAAQSDSIPMLCWVPNAAGYKRIMKAIGERYADKVDRDKLVADLVDARAKLLTFVVLDSDKGARARKELFRSIADSAIALRKRLEADSAPSGRSKGYASRAIAFTFPDASGFDAFLKALDRVIDAAKAGEEQNSRGGWVRLERSPTEWFAAEILPRVFERNFGRKAAVSKTGATPFSRFVVAVMDEMGMPITWRTVARAFTQVRAGCARRKKPRPTTLARPKGW